MLKVLKLLPLSALFLCIFLQPLPSLADEGNPGKTIHDRDCLGCHGVEMYTRTNLFVKSFRQLDAQVEHWLKENEITWSENEKDEVLDYLADEFYGFE